MKKLFLISTFAIMGLCASAKSQTNPNVLDLKTSITDETVIYPESFEADTQKMLEGWYMRNYTATDRRYEEMGDNPTSDEVIIKRLKELPTVIEMPFNQVVRQYIDRYTQNGRSQVAAILGMGLYYMPIFEQVLEERGLPLELKYLPVIESGLDPNAVSRHGATGLWQIMLGTAKGLGLEVTSLVDERRDPYAASQAAAGYLKDLYDTYGDWSLAIAAYNCGPGTVNKALRRAGGDPKSHDFWGIYYYLPAETRGYVPMFIAANYVMNHHTDHNISPVLPVKPLVTDTIHISDRIHFNQISHVLNIPVEEIRILNPQFRADIIPGTPDTPYTLILPSQQIHAYLMSENDIKSYDSDKYQRRDVVEPGEVPSDAMLALEEKASDIQAQEDEVGMVAAGGKSSVIVHKVAAGETLASIAERYGVTAADIRKSNNLRRNAVRVGQQLKIATTTATGLAAAGTIRQPMSDTLDANETQPTANRKKAASPQKKKSKKKAPKTVRHKVKKGESFYVIASKYGVTVEELKKANGTKSNNLQPGQTLKVPSKGKSGKSSSKKSKRKSSRKKRR